MAESTFMRKSIRDVIEASNHAGLKLQHGLTGNDETGKSLHRGRVAGTKFTQQPDANAYKLAFDRFDSAMKQPGVVRIRAELAGPLAASLGVASPTENGIALFHTYGAPTIPGSSIKGAFRRAVESLDTKLTAEQKVFLVGSDHAANKGDEAGRAGRLIFHDAWYEPAPIPESPLHPDIMTPHHGGYYSKAGAVAPADFEDPVPVGFVSVKRGTKFVFFVECPTTDPAWLAFVRSALSYTLTELGLGAKTNAGYGFFKVLG